MPAKRAKYGTIYALIDPRTADVRYVGQTRVGVAARLKVHLRDARNGSETYCANWLRQLVRSGLSPDVRRLVRVPVDDLDAAERGWISAGRALGWPLANLTDGGEASSMLNPEVAAKAIRRSRRARQTEEYSQKRRAIGRRLWQDPDYRAHMVLAHKGIKPVGEGARGRLADPNEPNPMDDPEVRRRAGQKISERWAEPEHKKRLSDATKARWADPEARQKMLENRPPVTEERRAQMSAATKSLWADPAVAKKMVKGRKGRKMTEAAKANMRRAQQARRAKERAAGTGCASAEFGRKVAAANRGRKASVRARKAMSDAQARRFAANGVTEETRKKLRASVLSRREEHARKIRAAWADPEKRAKMLAGRKKK